MIDKSKYLTRLCCSPPTQVRDCAGEDHYGRGRCQGLHPRRAGLPPQAKGRPRGPQQERHRPHGMAGRRLGDWAGGAVGQGLCVSPAGRRFNYSMVQCFSDCYNSWPETHEMLALALGAGVLSFTACRLRAANFHKRECISPCRPCLPWSSGRRASARRCGTSSC
jgi:hypothetical protein